MFSSNWCFLTCIQISQDAGKVVWTSHLLKNFPQCVVIHTVKGFGIVNKAEGDVFLELSCFSMIQWMLEIRSLVPLPFLNPACTSGSSWFTYCWSLVCRILSISLLACEMSAVQLCPTLCNPIDCSTPGLPVHHQVLELAQTHVHWVGDAIQPSHPLSSASPPAFSLSRHQGLFQWVGSLHQVAKILELQLQHQSF